MEYLAGMRFYIFNNDEDEEYKLYDLVGIYKNQIITLMDEETFEIIKVNIHQLQKEYILLTNYTSLTIQGIRQKSLIVYKDPFERDMNELIIFCNEPARRCQFLETIPNAMADFDIYMCAYPYMSKNVFTHMLNAVTGYDIDSYTIQSIWNTYLKSYCGASMTIGIDLEPYSTTMDEEYTHTIPESLFIKIEEELEIYIKTYQLYKMDTSIDMNKINMKYIVLFNLDTDKYYLLLYIPDDRRYALEDLKAKQENIDLINFMDK